MELNEKLARRAGFTYYGEIESQHDLSYGWSSPDGRKHHLSHPPDFTSSLDACVEYIVQDDWKVTFFERTNEGEIICWIDRFENGNEALKVPYRYVGVDTTHASAFCNAAEQIAGKETP